ncbi:MAG: TolC family protein [Magnetococcales bacterium]|nr:TolC family protein [Magnetococcales bacterium]
MRFTRIPHHTPFYLQTTEVTQGQWRAIMGNNPSGFNECGDACPVEQVSWHDAQTFITRLNALGDGKYRLPSQKEWEFAALANKEFSRKVNGTAWHAGNSMATTHPVAQKKANPWGLFDMAGNVREWLADAAPGSSGPEAGWKRATRGGDWSSDPDELSPVTHRFEDPNWHSITVGLRLVREESSKERPVPSSRLKTQLPQLLQGMLNTHERLRAVTADMNAARASLSKARGVLMPDIKASASMGPDHLQTDTSKIDSRLFARQQALTLNQTLWDFGKSFSEIDKAEIARRQAENNLILAHQELLLDGISAYVNLFKAYRTMDYARQSVENIQRQAGMEESRVTLGSGYPADVLQTKSQLAGAQARLTRARGGVETAGNRFRTLFHHEPPPLDEMQQVSLPAAPLPASLEGYLDQVRQGSLQLENVRLAKALAEAEERRVVGAELSPRVSLTAETNKKRNDSGAEEIRKEHFIKLEMNYQFNTGLAGVHALQASRNQKDAAEMRLQDASGNLEEQARNAWQNLLTLRENAALLTNQAHIAEAFLRMAQEERLQGRRSLIDVLAGETAMINAQSDAVAAEADVTIAAYQILKIANRLVLQDLP